ncbi:MAG: electron transport complex subunit RsxC [Gemmatimonadota bacterium]|nr:MAG: electron transport complex subunit RsxC [Gemmatimonadota bacterium]
MFQRTFKGGAHPPEWKHLTESKPIEDLEIPKRVVVPLQQHLGAPSEAIVQKGDEVKTGQPVSEAKGFVSVPSHASITGKVTAVEPMPHPLGSKAVSVVIEGDGIDVWDEGVRPVENVDQLETKQLCEMIQQAGLAGMGGAAFPTHVKLSPPPEKSIEIAILNGAECEPYLTSDHRLMLEQPEEILYGFRLIMRILGVRRGIIAIEANKPDAVRVLASHVKDVKNVSLVKLPVKYPQGAEKQLIKSLTGREVPPGGLPMDVACLVHNVGTAKAIHDAVTQRKPIVERIVTVTGPGVTEPKNLRVRIGTLFSELITACGGYRGEVGKLVMGGPMMGLAQDRDDVPVIKGTSGILVVDERSASIGSALSCISCARCVDACPMKLVPTVLGKLVEKKRFEEAKASGVQDCIECGCCAFVCPSKINLVHAFKYGKAEIVAMERVTG